MTLVRPPSERRRPAQTAPSPEVLFKEARRRRHRRWGIGALAAAAVAGLAAMLLPAGAPPPPRPPRRPARHQDEHAPTSKPPALPSMAWPVRPVAPTPSVRDVAATKTAVYWITGEGSGTCHPGATVPVRLDLATGKRHRGAPLAVCDTRQLVATGGRLWALQYSGAAFDLAALDPRTLAVTATEHFLETGAATGAANSPTCGTSCGALAAGPHTVLWLSDSRRVWRLAATSGAVEGQFTPANSASVLAPSPTGRLLYTSGRNPNGPGAVVDEYATSSGRLLAQVAFRGCIGAGPAELAAGPGSVWTSCRGGTAGDVYGLSSNGLTEVTRPRTPTTPFGPFVHVMGVGITISGGPLWLHPVGVLACADAAKGTVLAKMSYSSQTYGAFGPIVVARGHAYSTLPSYPAGVYRSRLYSVAAPKACFGA